MQWKQASPDQIMDSKLKCVFDIPEDYTPKVQESWKCDTCSNLKPAWIWIYGKLWRTV